MGREWPLTFSSYAWLPGLQMRVLLSASRPPKARRRGQSRKERTTVENPQRSPFWRGTRCEQTV